MKLEDMLVPEGVPADQAEGTYEKCPDSLTCARPSSCSHLCDKGLPNKLLAAYKAAEPLKERHAVDALQQAAVPLQYGLVKTIHVNDFSIDRTKGAVEEGHERTPERHVDDGLRRSINLLAGCKNVHMLVTHLIEDGRQVDGNVVEGHALRMYNQHRHDKYWQA